MSCVAIYIFFVSYFSCDMEVPCSSNSPITIADIVLLSRSDDGKQLIEKLADWGAVAKEGNLMCSKGHVLRLCVDNKSKDKVAWRCRQEYKNSHKKRVKCDE